MADHAESALVRYDVGGGVATITLASPANRNALSAAVRSGLVDALDAAATDGRVRVVLLSHIGPVFCSGMDLKEDAADPERQGVRELPAILRRITHCPKPVLARVGGPARAGGIGILAAADIVVAAPTATFAFSEVRIGLIPAVISVPVLRRVTPAAARELLLTGAVFSAARAVDIGLVNAVTDDLDGAVAGYLQDLLAGGPSALAGIKAMLHELDASAERYDRLLEISAAQFASSEAQEGALSFRGKRPARWVLSD